MATRAMEDDEFKDTEISQIPETWSVMSIKELAEVRYGKARPEKKGAVPAVGSGGVYAWVDKPLVEFPTIVIGRKGTAGKAWLYKEPCWPSDTTFYLDWTREVDIDFLYGYFRLNPLSGEHAKTTLPSLQKPDLEAYKLPFPPLPEQKRIAHVLSTIQQAIEAQDRVLNAAREFKRSLMHRFFKYGPLATEMPTKETQFGDVPADWREVSLGKHAHVQTGVAKGRKLDGQRTIEVPYLRVANVQDGHLDLKEIKNIRIKESELDRYSLQDGDVVLTEGGDFDKLGRGFIWKKQVDPCIHQNHIFAVRTDRQTLLPEYLAYLAQSEYGKRYFLKVAHRTTNLASINSTKLKAFPLLLPPLTQQRLIAEQLQKADDKIHSEGSRKTALEALFKSMLHYLMTGRIRVDNLEVEQ